MKFTSAVLATAVILLSSSSQATQAVSEWGIYYPFVSWFERKTP